MNAKDSSPNQPNATQAEGLVSGTLPEPQATAALLHGHAIDGRLW